MDEWECRRADRPFLQAAEEAEVRATEDEPWIVADMVVVVLLTAWVLETLEGAFVLAFVAAACAVD